MKREELPYWKFLSLHIQIRSSVLPIVSRERYPNFIEPRIASVIRTRFVRNRYIYLKRTDIHLYVECWFQRKVSQTVA